MAGKPPLPPPTPTPPAWLFKKKLSRRDVANAGVLSEVVVEVYSKKMKTVLEEKRGLFLRITAEDPMGDAYELRFAVNPDGNYVVFHQWGNVVTINDLREGDTVQCLGNFARDDSEIHATLDIHRRIRDSKLKVPLILPTEKQGSEFKRDGGKIPLLFEKILDGGDVDPYLGDLQFKRCHKRLRMALEETPKIKVSTVDQDNNVELTRLMITRYFRGDRYAIYQAWREVRTINGLKKGDSVLGYGKPVGPGEFRLQLYVLRDKPPSPGEGLKTEEERKEVKRRKEEGALLDLLLLEKGTEGVLGRVAIKSTGKERQTEVVLVKGVEMDDSDEDDAGGYAMFSAKRWRGGKPYEWSEKVDENGVSKSVGGAAVGDDKVQVNVDVYKSRYY